ncbi:MAG: 4-(cytidine 5'-diphospho)-2-C-methyl-D-erythritol kinase [Ruminococcaceae bacterium]|nr:4-(cytidine 5'-diphospho)-2-C-methyl-D-erythritol kinase [Oscillospiraceae bacterium]
MKKELTVKCPAKVNLSLDVASRREDGYHNLEMIMHTIKLFDTLTVTYEEAAALEINISSNLSYVPNDERNLCFKAAQLFFDETGLAAKVHINANKKIPVGAGLGGGSSDAAGALTALNALSGKPLSKDRLAEISKNIGADVPFFIYGGCMLAEGIGEILTPLPQLENVTFLIAKPNFGVSTPWVYKNLMLGSSTPHPDTKAVIEGIKTNDLSLIARHAGNTLESVTLGKYPEISRYKTLMEKSGAIYSLMSGSGSAVFGVFDDPDKAKKALNEFKRITKQVYIA